MESKEKIIKTGRILIGSGIGTIVGFCVPYNEETVERFTIPLIIAVIAIVAGLFMAFTTKNKVKLEELQSSNHYKGANSCPVCGLPLTLDCQKCPKCHTNVK